MIECTNLMAGMLIGICAAPIEEAAFLFYFTMREISMQVRVA